MSLMAANEESDPSAILNGFWVTLFFYVYMYIFGNIIKNIRNMLLLSNLCVNFQEC